MNNTRFFLRNPGIAFAAIAFCGAACSESYRSTSVQNPVPTVEAVLEISGATTVGAGFVVSVRATATQGKVGSFTARIRYDAAALRFDGAIPMDDAAMRALNPMPGQLRLAGAAANGFSNGRLASYRFVALRANGAETLSLVVDEMHLITHFDAKPTLTIMPSPVISR